MGKLLDNLNAQMQTEYSEDAILCIKIYNKLKELDNNSVWSSKWSVLTDLKYIGTFSDHKKIYKPSNVGLVFLNGL